jgi:NADPH2:quinone reductase
MRAGTIKAHIGQTFDLSDIAKAHEAIESGRTIGATLLKP